MNPALDNHITRAMDFLLNDHLSKEDDLIMAQEDQEREALDSVKRRLYILDETTAFSFVQDHIDEIVDLLRFELTEKNYVSQGTVLADKSVTDSLGLGLFNLLVKDLMTEEMKCNT